MPVRTKRWNEPPDGDPSGSGSASSSRPGDGFRVLVCRYRPRGVKKEDEPWDAWMEDLGPSRELHAAYWGKRGQTPISWDEYQRRYLHEVRRPSDRGAAMLGALAARVAAGQTVTLLCSSACTDPARCHRTLLAGLGERAAARATTKTRASR